MLRATAELPRQQGMSRSFHNLDEREILALAISAEEEDGKIYGAYAERVKADYPSTGTILEEMREEESEHRRTLIDLFKARFGDNIPLVRRSDVKGFIRRRPIWMSKVLTIKQIRAEVESMETEARRFYEKAAEKANNPDIRKLLGDLALAESKHVDLAEGLLGEQQTSGKQAEEEEARRRSFVLRVVQPGLAGLMDGSVSTLAPVFAAAFATRNSWDAFLVGMAASVGAGISMGFAEALSDDGALSGRGSPIIRGVVCGLMTTAGGIGHTVPFLIPDFAIATAVAVAVVIVELAVISWIRHHFMDTPLLAAVFQVVLGGFLVFLTGILIGSA